MHLDALLYIRCPHFFCFSCAAKTALMAEYILQWNIPPWPHLMNLFDALNFHPSIMKCSLPSSTSHFLYYPCTCLQLVKDLNLELLFNDSYYSTSLLSFSEVAFNFLCLLFFLALCFNLLVFVISPLMSHEHFSYHFSEFFTLQQFSSKTINIWLGS